MKVYIKKSLIIFLIFICVATIGAFSVSCTNENTGTKTITLVIGEGENQKVFSSYKTESEYLIDVLKELKEDGKITYTAQESIVGAYLTEINGISQTAQNYLFVLTTVSDAKMPLDDQYTIVKKYQEMELVSSSKGVSDLKLIDGEGYMIVLV
jgi:hypothetical protein